MCVVIEVAEEKEEKEEDFAIPNTVTVEHFFNHLAKRAMVWRYYKKFCSQYAATFSPEVTKMNWEIQMDIMYKQKY